MIQNRQRTDDLRRKVTDSGFTNIVRCARTTYRAVFLSLCFDFTTLYHIFSRALLNRPSTLPQGHKRISYNKHKRNHQRQSLHFPPSACHEIHQTVGNQSKCYTIGDRICKWHKYDCTEGRQSVAHVAEIHISDVTEHQNPHENQDVYKRQDRFPFQNLKSVTYDGSAAF